MRSLRSFERRLERVESKIAAEEKAAAAAKRGEEVDGLEADINRLCPFCIRILQREKSR